MFCQMQQICVEEDLIITKLVPNIIKRGVRSIRWGEKLYSKTLQQKKKNLDELAYFRSNTGASHVSETKVERNVLNLLNVTNNFFPILILKRFYQKLPQHAEGQIRRKWPRPDPLLVRLAGAETRRSGWTSE